MKPRQCIGIVETIAFYILDTVWMTLWLHQIPTDTKILVASSVAAWRSFLFNSMGFEHLEQWERKRGLWYFQLYWWYPTKPGYLQIVCRFTDRTKAVTAAMTAYCHICSYQSLTNVIGIKINVSSCPSTHAIHGLTQLVTYSILYQHKFPSYYKHDSELSSRTQGNQASSQDASPAHANCNDN